MTLKIIHKNNTSAGQAPASGDLDIGEIAVNSADAKLYTKDNDGAVQEFISKFEQTGSGAVKRTVESKLQDVVSVKDFGAVGDGVTDDTAAIQTAVNSHSHVFFPKGTYRVTSTITWNVAGSCLFGPEEITRDGAVIAFEQDDICFNFQGYSGRLQNIRIEGPESGNDIAFKAARIDSNTDDVDSHIIGCSFVDCSLAVQVIGRAATIYDNAFVSCPQCIDLQWPASGTSGTTSVQDLPYGWRGARIANNRAHSCALFLETSGSNTEYFRGAIISGNQLDIGERFFTGGVINSSFSNNIVELANSTIVNITAGGSGVVFDGNIFSGTSGDTAQSPAHAIIYSSGTLCDNVIFSNNRISSIDDHGIHIDTNSTGAIFTGNSFQQIAQSVGTAASIRMDGANNEGIIVCNNFYNPDPGTRGLVVTGSLSKSKVLNNSAPSGVSLFDTGLYTDAGDNEIQTSYSDTNHSSLKTISVSGQANLTLTPNSTVVNNAISTTFEGGTITYNSFDDDGSRGLRIRSVGGAAERGLLQIKGSSTVAANTTVFEHYAGGTDAADRTIFIATNGDIYNDTGTYGTISDLKFKKEVVDASEQWEDIKALRFVNYKLDKDIERDPENAKTLLGLVAQEVEQVSPGLVANNKDLDSEGNETGDTTKTLKLSVLFLKTAKALQEAIFKIEKLEEELSKLKHVT